MKPRVLTGLALAALAATLTGCSWEYLIPISITETSDKIDLLMWVIIWITMIVFIGVEVVLVWFILKYRDMGDGRKPVYTHGSNKLEAIWTGIPVLILIVLAVWSENLLNAEIRAIPEKPDVRIKVTARQFNWNFEITESSGEQIDEASRPIVDTGMHSTETAEPDRHFPKEFISGYDNLTPLKIPVDRTTVFEITSLDVIHSFWVPEFRIKQDAMPGHVNRIWIRPNKTGLYPIVCAELCGNGHYRMAGRLEVVTGEEYDAWVAEQASGGSDELF
ncbi:MAG: cytochrome c oxidase subunit II [Deltaproteobacteria bacterium]|nr:cytochrome c oxidase subunit II [Deltaproteobacteria bacterium]